MRCEILPAIFHPAIGGPSFITLNTIAHGCGNEAATPSGFAQNQRVFLLNWLVRIKINIDFKLEIKFSTKLVRI